MLGTEVKLSKTQQKIVDILKDGEMHSKDVLIEVLPENSRNDNNLRVHITLLRKKLKERARDIVRRGHLNKTYYRMVRHITDDE